MSIVLNIDTALEKASVCLAHDEKILSVIFNESQKDHAAWLHPAIAQVLKDHALSIREIDAIGVNIGPGSYTGLRVGLSAAKGFCYALKIPLITVESLEILAEAVKEEADNLICPLIDARRMEVFTCIFNKNLGKLLPTQPMVINADSFKTILNNDKILFCGNAIEKFKKIVLSTNAFFTDKIGDASHLARLSHKLYCRQLFADIAYVEPLYIKDFHSISPK